MSITIKLKILGEPMGKQRPKALSVGSEFLCSILIDTFVAQRKDYQAKDFEIIKLRKGEE